MAKPKNPFDNSADPALDALKQQAGMWGSQFAGRGPGKQGASQLGGVAGINNPGFMSPEMSRSSRFTPYTPAPPAGGGMPFGVPNAPGALPSPDPTRRPVPAGMGLPTGQNLGRPSATPFNPADWSKYAGRPPEMFRSSGFTPYAPTHLGGPRPDFNAMTQSNAFGPNHVGFGQQFYDQGDWRKNPFKRTVIDPTDINLANPENRKARVFFSDQETEENLKDAYDEAMMSPEQKARRAAAWAPYLWGRKPG